MRTTRTVRVRPGALFAAFLALLLLVVLAGILQGAQSSRAAAAGSTPYCYKPGTRAVTWFPEGCPSGQYRVGTSAAAPAVPSSSSTSASTTAATGELAPVLSLDGVPAVVGTVADVDLKWTPAKAPGAAGVAFYVVQRRASTDTAWRQPDPSTTATHAKASALVRGADYLFRVQAVYGDGERGPWSNTVAVSVPAGPASSPSPAPTPAS